MTGQKTARRPSRQRWDIFCRVVDNFGDIGICWRLAKQLVDEHGLDVRLWVDDLISTKRLLPEFDMTLLRQQIRGVDIHHWQSEFRFDAVADVVIEAFACELPENYVLAMVAKQPVWLNLEYLSAENWVEEYHLKPSPHPRLALNKTFFFPGFTEHTGGLLRERGLFAARDEFQKQQPLPNEFRQNSNIVSNTLKVSLFCYPHAPIHDLLAAMAASLSPVQCFIPESSILGIVSAFFGDQPLAVGDTRTRGNLTVNILPFLSQSGYDELLWSCDLNFVRGEDSWIRAIWAARPFVWLPYHQAEDTHLVKLAAFLERYLEGLDDAVAEPLRTFHMTWAAERFDPDMWKKLTAKLPGLQDHAAHQANALGQQADLAAKLVIFCENFS